MSSPEPNDVALLEVDESGRSPIGSYSVQTLALENQRDVEGATNCVDIVDEVKTWISEIETVRDKMHLLSVKNAVLLDSLAMAGNCAES